MAVEFVKYHGLGNDFILIEDFGGELLPGGDGSPKPCAIASSA